MTALMLVELSGDDHRIPVRVCPPRAAALVRPAHDVMHLGSLWVVRRPGFEDERLGADHRFAAGIVAAVCLGVLEESPNADHLGAYVIRRGLRPSRKRPASGCSSKNAWLRALGFGAKGWYDW